MGSLGQQVTQVMIPPETEPLHTLLDTMERAPAYSFRGTKCPSSMTCSPGPRYFIDSSITKTGKHVPPTALVTARPKTKIAVTPGPSDYTTEPANKHVYLSAPANSMVSRPKDLKGFQTPGPAAYTLPKVMGPRTAYTHAEPCYSMLWKSQYQSCFQDLAKTPGPAAFQKVELDVYKPKAPKYTMGLKTNPVGKGIAPGPADYSLGKVRQPAPQPVMLDSRHLRTAPRTRHLLHHFSPHFPFQVSVTKCRDPAFSFGIRHSLYKASLVPEKHLD
uniref:ODF3A protein n=1 Tax=Ficedula albicollis TaxID=59894 RepID=A0A803W464_FICAL